MRSYLTLFLLGLAHGLNDFIAGALLAKCSNTLPISETTLWFIVYVSLAFAGQVPLAILADKWPRWKMWMLFALTCISVAILLAPTQLTVAIVLSGCASAIVHVAGGAWALQLKVPQGFGAGVFAAPGIVGLTLGGFTALTDFSWQLTLPVALLLLSLLPLLTNSLREKLPPSPATKSKHLFDVHDAFMLLLLLIITLRSAVWDIFQAINTGNEQVLLGIALAAAAGKITGGWLADKMNSLHVLGGTLFASLLVLQFSEKHTAFLYTGIALLQATLPASVLQINKLLPNLPAMTNALVLGLAVVLGSFPMLLDAAELFFPLSIVLLMIIGIFYFIKRKQVIQ